MSKSLSQWASLKFVYAYRSSSSTFETSSMVKYVSHGNKVYTKNDFNERFNESEVRVMLKVTCSCMDLSGVQLKGIRIQIRTNSTVSYSAFIKKIQ